METKEQKIIINILYIGLILTTVFGFAPSINLQIISLFLLLLVVSFAKIFKGRDKEDGLMYNHMTYLLRTVALGSALLVVCLIAAGIFAVDHVDNSSLDALMNDMANGNGSGDMNLNSVLQNYAKSNESVFTQATLISAVPAIFYFVYRIGNGYSRAMKGYRIANPKSWL